MTAAVFVVVLGGVVAGFGAIGPPSHARAIALDQRRVTDLQLIVSHLIGRRDPLPSLPPSSPDDPRDPATGKRYTYVRESATRYRLCTTFALASDKNGDDPTAWQHPAGPACFRFDVTSDTPIGAAFAPPAGARDSVSSR